MSRRVGQVAEIPDLPGKDCLSRRDAKTLTEDQRLTLELSGGVAVHLNEMLDGYDYAFLFRSASWGLAIADRMFSATLSINLFPQNGSVVS